jgi:hypothetical protein
LSKNDTWTAEYCQFTGWGKIGGQDNLLKIKIKKNYWQGVMPGMVFAFL